MGMQGTNRPAALVTGASSGIGAAFAERLAQDDHDLILVARRRDRLEALANQLREAHPVNVEVLEADLSQADNLKAVEKRIADHPALALLINNAGFGGYMPFVELDADKAEELIRVQVVAVTRLTRAALPGMIERKQGAIINVSSRLGFSAGLASPPLPKRATYAGTKAFINTFSKILADELQDTGVKVQALCPGLVETEFHDHVGLDTSTLPPGLMMSAEDVVTASLAGLAQGEVICVPPLADPALLAAVFDSQRAFFEQSRTGKLADRYHS